MVKDGRPIAICNWNERGDRIVTELHAAEAEPGTEIVIVTDKPVDESELRKKKEYENVYFIRSDPQLHDVLRRAQITQANSVIILADGRTPAADARSALIALAIPTLWEEEEAERKKKAKRQREDVSGAQGSKQDAAPCPHIIVEAVNQRKSQHLKDAGADEVICAADYGLGILAQCAIEAKLSFVYQRLLTYSGDTNEIYTVPRRGE